MTKMAATASAGRIWVPFTTRPFPLVTEYGVVIASSALLDRPISSRERAPVTVSSA
jgi:hypothetical protein